MNFLSGLFRSGENLDTYLLLILIFTLIKNEDDSGAVFALGYLLLVSDNLSDLTKSSMHRSHSEEVSVYPSHSEY